MATVKGDVHDIGKNIDWVVLQCNNYDVCRYLAYGSGRKDSGNSKRKTRRRDRPEQPDYTIIGRDGACRAGDGAGRIAPATVDWRGDHKPGAHRREDHTALSTSIVHVLDASRAVDVVNSLLNEGLKSAFDKKTREDYERLRRENSARTQRRNLLTLKEDTRKTDTEIDWSNYVPPKPEFLSERAYQTAGSAGTDTVQLLFAADAGRVLSIGRRFFTPGNCGGVIQRFFEDSKIGERARELFDDAQKTFLIGYITKNLLVAHGVHAFWRAN